MLSRLSSVAAKTTRTSRKTVTSSTPKPCSWVMLYGQSMAMAPVQVAFSLWRALDPSEPLRYGGVRRRRR